MLCENSGLCDYYSTFKNRTTRRQYLLLIEHYCEGALQSMCRRAKFREETGETPPRDLCPNGYRVGGTKRSF